MLKLAARELEHKTLASEALTLVRAYLDTRMIMWTTLDPATNLPTSLYLPGFIFKTTGFLASGVYYKRYADIDLDPDEILSVPWLLNSQRQSDSLHRATQGKLSKSRRYSEGLSKFGFSDELRVALTDSGQCWGLVTAARKRRPFSEDEIEAMGLLGPILGASLRLTLLRAALSSEHSGENNPGLLLFDEADELEHISPEARELLGEEVEDNASYWLSLLQQGEVGKRLNVMAAGGALTIHHTTLGGHEALIIERSRPAVLATWLIRAYGLSSRESEVVSSLCRGWSTRQIAAELFITEWTVQDHLKSIFDKVGVRSRKELISHLLLKHYLPRQRQKAVPSPHGWFLE